MESTNDKSQESGDSGEDTMKTIQSNFVNTGRSDTLEYSGTMGTMSRK